jgi:hypothetical protein
LEPSESEEDIYRRTCSSGYSFANRELGNALGKYIIVGQCCFEAEIAERRYDGSLNCVGTVVMKGKGAKEKNRCAIVMPTHFQMYPCFVGAVTPPPSKLAVT